MTNQLGRYAILFCSWDVDSLVGRPTNLKAQQAIVVQSAMRLVARKTRVVPPIRQFAESTLGSQIGTKSQNPPFVCSQTVTESTLGSQTMTESTLGCQTVTEAIVCSQHIGRLFNCVTLQSAVLGRTSKKKNALYLTLEL